MTVATIFARYAVEERLQKNAYTCASYALTLKKHWLGPPVDWNRIVQALLFTSLGVDTKTIRKKIGLDKYVLTLISRGAPQFIRDTVQDHDLHQKVYVYCLWQVNGVPETVLQTDWVALCDLVEQQSMEIVASQELTCEHQLQLARIDIRHYKNPSV